MEKRKQRKFGGRIQRGSGGAAGREVASKICYRVINTQWGCLWEGCDEICTMNCEMELVKAISNGCCMGQEREVLQHYMLCECDQPEGRGV